MNELRPEHPGFDGPPWQDAVRRAGGWSEPREIRVTASRPAVPEQFVDYIASVSWVASLPTEERAQTLARVAAIVSAGEAPAELPVHTVIGLTARLR
jgi:hypothetical protein